MKLKSKYYFYIFLLLIRINTNAQTFGVTNKGYEFTNYLALFTLTYAGSFLTLFTLWAFINIFTKKREHRQIASKCFKISFLISIIAIIVILSIFGE